MDGAIQKTATSRRFAVRRSTLAGGALAAVGLLVGVLAISPAASAAAAPVGLGTAAGYSVLGGQTVTNTGPTTLGASLGVSPGTAITGFPPGIVTGAVHAADAAAAQAQSDLVIAYNDAAGRAPTASIAGDLVGQTLTPGVYNSTGPIGLSGTLTFNALGNPQAVFVVQVASTLITASASTVSVINGAQACNIYWQVGSSATLGTTSAFQGTIMALTSITVTTGTVVHGRALARNGQVSLDSDVFTAPNCASTTPSSTASTATPASTVTTGTSGLPVATRTSTPAAASTASSGARTAVAAAETGPGTGTSRTELANTGANEHGTLATGGLLVLLGGLLLVAAPARRRLARHSAPSGDCGAFHS